MPNSLIPGPIREADIGPELGALLEERVFAPARALGTELPLVDVTDPPPPVELRRSPHGTWWLAASSEADPVAISNGGIAYAPPDVVENLRSLRAAGVDFDYVFVLHELPGDWTPGTALPAMKLAGSASGTPVVAAQEATFAFGRELLQAAVRAAGVLAKGAATVGGGAAALAAGAASAIAYDPVVLGGIKDPNSDQIGWVVVAAWDEVPR